MGQVVELQQRPSRRERTGAVPIPARFEARDRRRILERAARDGFSLEEATFAVAAVRLWAETNQRRRVRWDLVVTNALRQGWALRGFKQWQERQPGEVNARTGLRLPKRTALVPAVIDRVCGDTAK